MKKWCIAAGVSIIPIFFLGLAIPGADIINFHQKEVNKAMFWIFLFVLASAIAIVVTVLLRITSYSSYIDRLDEKEAQADMRNKRLNDLIHHYNKLISDIKTDK